MVCTKFRKRILSVSLSLLTCLFLFLPIISSAMEENANAIQTQGKCGENISWKLSEDGTLTISGVGTMFDYDDENTSSWGGEGVKRIVVEKGVTRIGNNAFLNCYVLESVELPASITGIGSGVFRNCEKLTSVTIPHNATKVGTNLFEGSKVKTVFVPKNFEFSVPTGITLYMYDTTGEEKDGVIDATLSLQYGQAAPEAQIAKPYKLDMDYSYDNLGEKKEYNGLVNYISGDTVSAVFGNDKVLWVKLDTVWYGIDSTSFEKGDVFQIHRLSKDKNQEEIKKLDDQHKSAAVKETLKTFAFEVRHPDGTICTEYQKPFDFYIQLEKDWNESNFHLVQIMDGTDKELTCEFKDWPLKNSEGTMRVAKVSLNDFGSFALYVDNGGSNETNGQESNAYLSKTADTLTTNTLFELPAFMLLALGGIYVSLKKKK